MDAACPYALYMGRLAPNSQRSIASFLVTAANIKPVAGECATSDFGTIATTIHAEHEASADGIGA